MKQLFKRIIVHMLGRQVRRLRKKHSILVVGVVGSIGKTSTKLAIAEVLGKGMRVRYQDGNYNDIVSVPLIFFGQQMPHPLNPFGWLKIWIANQRQLMGTYPYDAVIVELGTDGPGQIEAFAAYLTLDIGILTAVAPEHMEYFGTIEAVAQEELSVQKYAAKMLVNTDMLPETANVLLPANAITYSMSGNDDDYHIANLFKKDGMYQGDVKHGGEIVVHFRFDAFAQQQLYAVLAAIACGNELSMKNTDILQGIEAIKPVSGRLRRLQGIKGATIIDDTYNASPDAVKAALQALYEAEAPQKIALLGNMNELGQISENAHRDIGELCDPAQLAYVITIGLDANKHLASAAEAKGCMVKRFDNPYAAGEYLQAKLEPGGLLLAKGSQNGVFAEEAIKQLLADPEDIRKLVRQSDYWLKRKAASFKK